jgi:hypothetical protein
MTALSLEFGGEAAFRSRATNHGRSSAIGYKADMLCPRTHAALNGRPIAGKRLARRDATHTDPQILLSVAAS